MSHKGVRCTAWGSCWVGHLCTWCGRCQALPSCSCSALLLTKLAAQRCTCSEAGTAATETTRQLLLLAVLHPPDPCSRKKAAKSAPLNRVQTQGGVPPEEALELSRQCRAQAATHRCKRADGKHRQNLCCSWCITAGHQQALNPPFMLVARAALHALTTGIAQCLGTLGSGTPHRGSLQGTQSVSLAAQCVWTRQLPFSMHMLGIPDVKFEVLPRQMHRAPQSPCSCTAVHRVFTLPLLQKRSPATPKAHELKVMPQCRQDWCPRQHGHARGHQRQGMRSPKCRTAGRTALVEWVRTGGGRGLAACAGVGGRPRCCCVPRLRTGSGWAWTREHGAAGTRCLQVQEGEPDGHITRQAGRACRAQAHRDASLSGTGGRAQGCTELWPGANQPHGSCCAPWQSSNNAVVCCSPAGSSQTLSKAQRPHMGCSLPAAVVALGSPQQRALSASGGMGLPEAGAGVARARTRGRA